MNWREKIRRTILLLVIFVSIVIGGSALHHYITVPSDLVPQSPPAEAPIAEISQVQTVTVTIAKPNQECIWNEAGKRYRCSYVDAQGAKTFEPRRGGPRLVKPYDSTEIRPSEETH